MKTTTVDVSVHQRLLDQVGGVALLQPACCRVRVCQGLWVVTCVSKLVGCDACVQVKEERAGYASRIDETSRSYKEELAGRQKQASGGGGGAAAAAAACLWLWFRTLART